MYYERDALSKVPEEMFRLYKYLYIVFFDSVVLEGSSAFTEHIVYCIHFALS
jgi:hypothetical protein